MQIAANVVKRLRYSRGWTKAELATASGVSERVVGRIERGGYLPQAITVKRIADSLGVPVDDILIDDDGVITGAVGQAIANG